VPVEISGGSDLGSAIELVRILYGDLVHLRVIIFTDGGSTQIGENLSLPRSWDTLIVGLGGDALSPIPLGYDALGEIRYKYASGEIVRVRYEEENIQKYARALGARTLHENIYQAKKGPILHRNTLIIIASLFLLF
jgi:hypothetical protein